MFRPKELSLKAAAVSALLLVLTPFLRLEGEHIVFGLGAFQQAVPGSCWFRSVTGLDCPFCGLSRGFVCAAHFRFAEAWRYNWVAIPALAFAVFYAAAGLFVLLRHKRKEAATGRWTPAAVAYSRVVLGVVLLAGWLARVITRLA